MKSLPSLGSFAEIPPDPLPSPSHHLSIRYRMELLAHTRALTPSTHLPYYYHYLPRNGVVRIQRQPQPRRFRQRKYTKTPRRSRPPEPLFPTAPQRAAASPAS